MLNGLLKFNIKSFNFITNHIIAILKSFTILLLGLNIIFINLVWLNSISFKTTTLLLTALVLLINVFAYFTTIYSYSKFTAMVKFFWIRVFALIWFLEFYIFIIFMFLYIISPNELQIFWDPIRSSTLRTPNISNINTYFTSLIAVMLLNYYPFFKQYSNNNSVLLITFLFVLLLLYIFIKEFKSFTYYTYISNFQKFKPISFRNSSGGNDFLELKSLTSLKTQILHSKVLEDDVRHHIPSIFILNIILGVKFIHVYFIILISFILIFYSLYSKDAITLTVLGALQQNTIILLIFWSLNYIIFFKMYYKTMAYSMYRYINVNDYFKTIHWIKYEVYLV